MGQLVAKSGLTAERIDSICQGGEARLDELERLAHAWGMPIRQMLTEDF